MKFKNKYEALNFLNDKYQVLFYEVTCHQEAEEFWNAFSALWEMGRIEENDMRLGELAMDRF